MVHKILLIGSTDLTLRIAEFLYSKDMLSGIVNTNEVIKNKSGYTQKNYRYQDLKEWCEKKKVSFFRGLGQEDIVIAQNETRSNIALLAGVHNIIKKNIIDKFPLGIFAIHASLLPHLRGWSPLNWSILLGLKETGVSLFKVSSGMDDGPIVYQHKFIISSDAYIEDLIEISHKETIKILEKFILDIKNHKIQYTLQNLKDSTFILQRKEEDSLIYWSLDAQTILKIVRASSRPYFGAFTYLKNKKVRIFKAKESPLKVFGRPGQIFKLSSDMLTHVCCGQGNIMLQEVEVEGVVDEKDFLNQNLNECFMSERN